MAARIYCILLFLLIGLINCLCHNVTYESEIGENSKILSRRKRFLVFPEGSSFQIVFCNTFPMIFTIGDIFLYGYTAALAYELPQDPYSPFMHHGDPLHRRMDSKMIYFTDDQGKVLFKKKYAKKPIVNPAFAKRSVDGPRSVNALRFKKGTEEKFKIDRKQMHASKHKREFLKSEHMDERSVEFHRSSRAVLYPKIETLFQAFGENGRHCVLKTLCLIGQTQHLPQGSFFHEMMRAVFTLPKGSTNEETKDYDDAHSATTSCDDLYPECVDPTHSDKIPTLSY